ncbi:MAG: hypothetical protein ACTSPB_02280 [Candidatus Thorarchaeota archaeon]
MMSSKNSIGGQVIEIGWEPIRSNRTLIYALVKVKIATTKRQDKADKHLQTLKEKILGKKVIMFPS